MRKTLGEITHNCRIKIYPDGSRVLLCASAAVFREAGYERADKWDKEPRGSRGGGDIERSKRRARSAVKDIALSNEFRYFVTLTLDQRNVNRYDVAEVTKRLNTWLDNQVRRRGLAYVLVAERHKDGAVHFHGFFNGALPVLDSGTLDTGSGKPKRPRSEAQRAAWLADGARVVYNLPAWSLGFSTAIELYGERRKAVGYVCKYITKAEEKVGGRWYYSGGDLQRPALEFADAEYAELCAAYPERVYSAADIGVTFVEVELDGDGTGALVPAGAVGDVQH